MNRYAVEGIVRDIASGKRVAVLTDRVSESWHQLLDSVPADEAIRVTRSHGSERIDHANGGSVIVRRKAGPGLRGHSLDVIYVEPGGLTDIQLAENLPALAARNGELVGA